MMQRSGREFLGVAFAASTLLAPVVGYATPTSDRPVDAPVVAPETADQSQAAIAFGANRYLAVWLDEKASGTSNAVVASRIDPAGLVLDDPPLVVADQGSSVTMPAVAFDGARFLIVWIDLMNGGEVVGRYLDPTTGSFSSPVTLSPESIPTRRPSPRCAAAAATRWWRGPTREV